MANVNVSKTDFQVSVNASTNEVTVTSTPTTLVIQSEAYSPVSSVNTKTGAVVLTTSDISEGTNLYYTPGRFDTRLATKTTSDIAEGTNLYYTNDRFDTRLATKSINVLSDVNTTTAPTNGQSLIWNSATSQWIPGDGTSFTTQEVNVTPANTENNNFYVPFVRENSGSEPILSDTGLTYNPNTNTLGSATPINISGNATSATYVDIVQSATDSVEREVLFRLDNSVAYDQDDQITYNPNLGRLSVANLTVSGTISGTVSSATNAGYATNAGSASNVTATALNSFASTVYPLFATSASGSIGPGTDTGLTYVPSTNTLTTTTFVGALTGNADTATTATNANNIAITSTTPSSTHYIPFVNGSSGNQVARASSSLYINGATNELYTSHKVKSTAGFYGDLYGNLYATNDSGIVFYEATGNGSNYVTLTAASAMASNYDLNLPASQGSSGTVLRNDGSGNLTWVNTDGITEGSTNKYFSNTLARGAVSAANSGTGYGSLAYDSGTGVFTFDKVTGANIRSEVVDGRNLTYTSSTLDLDKALTSVNSISAESATDLTLDGKTVQLKTRDVSVAANTLNINSLGYKNRADTTTVAIASYISATSIGTTSATFQFYTLLSGTATSGSSAITGVVIVDDNGNVVDATAVTDLVGLPLLDADLGYFQFGVRVASITNIQGTYNSSPGTNTQTSTINIEVADQASSALALQSGVITYTCSHYARNSDSTQVALIRKLPGGTAWYPQDPMYRTPTNTAFYDGNNLAVAFVSYSYTGTQDWQISPRRIINLGPQNRVNEQLRVPFGLGVGPGSLQTNRGMLRDPFDAVGININNNGKLIGFSGKTGLNLTQFKNNSPFANITANNPAERCGPNFTFNSFAGNEDTANASLFLTDQDGIGQITWFSQLARTTLSSSTFTPASITVKATESHDTTSKHGAGMYLQYTPNSMGVVGGGTPRTFLRAENATTDVLARTTLRLGKISTATNATSRTLSASPQATWATVSDTSLLAGVPVRTTITQATVARGGTYTPPVTAMNSIILEITAGAGVTTIDVSNLTVAGENAVFDIMIYNNSGGNINANDFVIVNHGNTALDHGSVINNGSRAMFEVNCVDIYANAKYAGDAV